ncbi:PAS domain-containing sensor histidine kinase [Paracidovorax citrulli]
MTNSSSPSELPHIQNVLATFAERSLQHCILALDANGVVTWASAGAGEILGAAADALIGTWFGQYFTPEDRATGIPEHELEVSKQTGSASDDRWMARSNGSQFWASGVTVFLGADQEPARFLKIFRDFTAHHTLLATTRAQAAVATDRNEDIRVAIAMVAHELRSPLAGIMLGLELLGTQTQSPESSASVLRNVSENSSLALQLVDDLLNHSRVLAQGFRIETSICTLRDLLESSTQIAIRQMCQPDRSVPVLVPSADIEIQVDRMRMQQVMVNLLTNALRCTPEPGRIWVTGTIEGSEVIVRVTDEGVGIDPSTLNDLFKSFTRVGVKGTRLGLGLGLALAKKILEQHGGSVQALSEGVGKGSQFVARFPKRAQPPSA